MPAYRRPAGSLQWGDVHLPTLVALLDRFVIAEGDAELLARFPRYARCFCDTHAFAMAQWPDCQERMRAHLSVTLIENEGRQQVAPVLEWSVMVENEHEEAWFQEHLPAFVERARLYLAERMAEEGMLY